MTLKDQLHRSIEHFRSLQKKRRALTSNRMHTREQDTQEASEQDSGYDHVDRQFAWQENLFRFMQTCFVLPTNVYRSSATVDVMNFRPMHDASTFVGGAVFDGSDTGRGCARPAVPLTLRSCTVPLPAFPRILELEKQCYHQTASTAAISVFAPWSKPVPLA